MMSTRSATIQAIKTKITTSNVQATRSFYERAFGLVAVETWNQPDDAGVILGLPDGRHEALIEVYQGQDMPLAGLSLQFKVDDLETFVSTLPADLPFEGPTPRPWGSTYLYLRDPNGVQVIVYEGGL